MTNPFEALVIQNLSEIKSGQGKILQAFDDHKTYVDQKFVSLAIKQAEDAGAAKLKARMWSVGGALFTTIFAGSYEALRHYLHWK